ncbi:nuclear transport factor 2 family protein [Mucilaginibacter psychrotolerans]|uniref:Nuclear transport factor 2 family protein n=1 Tax=Mucilaginibacter psychrotolerans TaxID=1524096 RepID=A0A4Y8SFC9_9SPHI|nr:nuclear transport factor 2 family protein [Mucilaginibacter psychrotolerans]TFF37257.1 nuclear transport factor 2 family protein [Mucilaginibacter psychrotolerans]
MNLHKTIANLVAAQNNHDSQAYVACFSDAAIVHDEGKTHQGKAEIRQWIARSDHEYHTELKPLTFEETGAKSLLTAEVSGEFPGSPAVLRFHFQLEEGLISSLRITG